MIPIVGFRRAKSLNDILVRAKVAPLENEKVSCRWCGGTRCKIFKHVVTTETFRSKPGMKNFITINENGEKNDRVYYRTMYLHEANSFFVTDKPDISLSFSVFTKIKSKMSFWEGYTIRSMKVWNSPKTSFSNWLSQKLVIMIIFGPGTFVKIYFHQAVAQEHVRTVSMAKICFPIPNNDNNYQQWLSDENCICCCISKSCEAIELY